MSGIVAGMSSSVVSAHSRLDNEGGRWTLRFVVISREGGNPVATLEVEERMRATAWAGDSSAWRM